MQVLKEEVRERILAAAVQVDYENRGHEPKPKPEERDVSRASVDAIPDQACTGSAVEPRTTVRLGARPVHTRSGAEW